MDRRCSRGLIIAAIAFSGALAISAVSQTAPGTRFTGGPVAFKAATSSCIGFEPPNVHSVTFNFTDSAMAVVQGQKVIKSAAIPPTWTLQYDLDARHNIQVCAYVSPELLGKNLEGSIPGAWLYGTPIGGVTTAFTGNGCGLPNNAVTLDEIRLAKGSVRKVEGFTALSLQLPGGQVPAPGTYYGTLTIVAQVQ